MIIPISVTQYSELIERIEKLEQFERESRMSPMLLFWAEVRDYNFIIAAPDVETAILLVQAVRHNNNVEFLGRATIEYDKPMIVKQWPAYNWDARDDSE